MDKLFTMAELRNSAVVSTGFASTARRIALLAAIFTCAGLAKPTYAVVETNDAAKIAKASKPISNEVGAIRYIVLLDDGRKLDSQKTPLKDFKKAEVEADIEAIKRATDKLIAEITRPVDVKVLQSTALLLPTWMKSRWENWQPINAWCD